MGGFGSGRSEYAVGPTVERSLHLDVTDLADALTPGVQGELRWGDPDAADENKTTVGFATLPTSGDVDAEVIAVQLEYTATRGEDSTKYAYRVPITHTPCNFGGERPWFRCPAEGCGDRVRKLYLPPGREEFACRECHGLAYESSRASGDPIETAVLRYKRVHRKLAPNADSHHPSQNGTILVTKPKGMHWDTYEDLYDDLRDAHDAWLNGFMTRNVRMTRSFERLYERRGYDEAAASNRERRKETEAKIEEGRFVSPADAAALKAFGLLPDG